MGTPLLKKAERVVVGPQHMSEPRARIRGANSPASGENNRKTPDPGPKKPRAQPIIPNKNNNVRANSATPENSGIKSAEQRNLFPEQRNSSGI
jgi:hypothetical protein